MLTVYDISNSQQTLEQDVLNLINEYTMGAEDKTDSASGVRSGIVLLDFLAAQLPRALKQSFENEKKNRGQNQKKVTEMK